jgi:hypothetical protein
MLVRTLLTLADVSVQFGFIGIDEYRERYEIARWLNDNTGNTADPRETIVSDDKPDENAEPVFSGEPELRTSTDNKPSGSDWIELLWQAWVFTKADPDPYPSTPHGHWLDPNQKWPKLNPYTGPVFKQKHQEDSSRRLKKKDMAVLWNNERFRDFCRSYILWYMGEFPYHDFPVPHPLRFPRW